MNSVSTLNVSMPTAASAALSGRRCVAMDQTNAGLVKIPTNNATELNAIIGVTLENQPTNARNVDVQVAGIVTVESDGSTIIIPGARVKVATTTNTTVNGRVAAITNNSAAMNTANTGIQMLGICVNDAAVPATAGELVAVAWAPQMYYSNA